MSVFVVLAKEHRLFYQLVDQLEGLLKSDRKTAQKDMEAALLTLLPALDRHEKMEDQIFEDAAYEMRGSAKRFLTVVAAQHNELELLRKDILDLLGTDRDVGAAKLRSMVARLCQGLKAHFYTEETRLWPQYNHIVSGPSEHSLALRAQQNVKDLEAEMRDDRAPA